MLIVKAIAQEKSRSVLRKIILFACFLILSPEWSVARDFDYKRDMGICANEPNLGKDCVTVSYKIEVKSIEKAEFEINQHLLSFQLIATKNNLGNTTLQYSSFLIKPNNKTYTLNAKATYHFQSTDLADKFVELIRKQGFEAEILANLMSDGMCVDR